ncbi:UNVERIFIED_CONTAM: hypothetical protein Sradi_2491500 [Sesamum radiatum]|uniref:Uncharacterized protein n=1 Tax=Sesamum radiatum TaxID=300843 RepID=A0AAW2SJS8_SESRA
MLSLLVLALNFESYRLGFITWSNTSFGHIRKKVRHLEERIVQLQKLPVTGEIATEIRECTGEIERCLAQEEVVEKAWQSRMA